MKYDISKPTAPKMPELGRGTECIKILLSQASKTMLYPLFERCFLRFRHKGFFEKNSTHISVESVYVVKWLIL